ncbi:Uncharacterised protein [Mycobacteroides abscessus subsp. abscessus]|nr:Uncharacterised protein [Mycobacteroides abscessus subsp. abscessus]
MIAPELCEQFDEVGVAVVGRNHFEGVVDHSEERLTQMRHLRGKKVAKVGIESKKAREDAARERVGVASDDLTHVVQRVARVPAHAHLRSCGLVDNLLILPPRRRGVPEAAKGVSVERIRTFQTAN